MLLLGHLGLDPEAWHDPVQASSRTYPDLYAVCPWIDYRATHCIEPAALLRLAGALHAESSLVRHFAAGMLRHLRDDRRLPLLASVGKTWAAPLAAHARACLSLPALAPSAPRIEQFLMSDIVAAALELWLASALSGRTWHPLHWSSVIDPPDVVRFVGRLWALPEQAIARSNARWRELFSQFGGNSPAAFVDAEIRLFWPTLCAGRLYEAGIATARQSVLARRELAVGMDTLLPMLTEATRESSFRLDTARLLDGPDQAEFALYSSDPLTLISHQPSLFRCN